MLKARDLVKPLALILSVGMLSTAAFAASSYTLTVSPDLTDGTYYLNVEDPDNPISLSAASIKNYSIVKDSAVNVTAPLVEGGQGFVQWDGGPAAEYSSNSIRFTMDGNRSITARYAPFHKIKVNITTKDENGNILQTGITNPEELLWIQCFPPNDDVRNSILNYQLAGKDTFDAPEGVVVEAGGDSGWLIESLSSDAGKARSLGANMFIMPNRDANINVILKKTIGDTPGGTTHNSGSSGGNNFMYILTGSAGEGGRIVKEGAQQVREATDRLYRILPDEGWEIGQVLVDGRPAQLENDGEYWFREVRRDHTIHVDFRRLEPESKPESKPVPHTGR